jgi:hypothetical protein
MRIDSIIYLIHYRFLIKIVFVFFLNFWFFFLNLFLKQKSNKNDDYDDDYLDDDDLEDDDYSSDEYDEVEGSGDLDERRTGRF